MGGAIWLLPPGLCGQPWSGFKPGAEDLPGGHHRRRRRHRSHPRHHTVVGKMATQAIFHIIAAASISATISAAISAPSFLVWGGAFGPSPTAFAYSYAFAWFSVSKPAGL